MSVLEDTPRAHWGLAGFCFGVCALLAAVMMTSGLLAPSPDPDQSIGTVIGEIARDIRLAATGGVKDVAPAPEPAFDMLAMLSIVTPVLAVLAAVLGGISLFRHEGTALPKLAIGFGVGAVVMQFAFWLALLICGTVMIVSIVSNMDGILGG